MNVQSFGTRHRGRRRNNEDFVTWFEPTDSLGIEKSGCLYILADGVGGAAKGEIASKYAAEMVRYEFYQLPDMAPGERLRHLMVRANDDIFSHAEQSGSFKRMATTMVAVVVHNGKLIVANVGDSRAYLIRGDVSSQLTRDHSIVGEMVANKDMTEAEAQASKIKNRLTRSIGGEAEVHVDVFPPISLQPGDKILLCSDGLTRYALREDISRMTAEGSPQEIVERLIKYANNRGGVDNVSAILILYEGTKALEPVIHIQKLPRPPNLEETLDTIPYMFPRRKKVVISIVGVVIALGIFGIATFGLTIGFPGTSQFAQPSITAEFPTESFAIFQTLTITPQNPLLPTESPTTSPTLTPATSPSETMTQLASADCYYTIRSGDYPILIAERFGIGSDNWRLMECLHPDGCTLNDPQAIRAGWIVRIPNIQPAVCENNGGRLEPISSRP